MTTHAAAVRRFHVSTATTATMRCFDVYATTSAARRTLECLHLLRVLMLEGLHLLRVLTL